MKTPKQILQKNIEHLSGYGLLTPDIAIEGFKEWLQQKIRPAINEFEGDRYRKDEIYKELLKELK